MLFTKLKFKNRQDGYIAIVSAVIMTAIVIIIALVFSSSNFLGRFDSQSVEMKEIGHRVADGCLDYIRLKLAQGSYSGTEIKSIGSYSCTILPISSQSGQYTAEVKVIISNRTVNYKLVIQQGTLNIISLEELPSF